MKRSLVGSLEKALGPDQVCFPSDTAVFRPRDIDSLAEGMRVISAAKGKVAIAGGGAPPAPVSRGDVIGISLARMNEVREVNSGDFIVVAGAGAIADEAVKAAREERMLVPLDITSGERATVGGAYMTAAIGPYAAGYGPFRDYVIGAKCVTAGGDIVTFGGRTMKNVTGYEITRFLAGTRGIFAIAAELTLKALPLPERQTVLLGKFNGFNAPWGVPPEIEKTGGVVKACELVAEEGLGGEILLAFALEGMAPMVRKGLGIVRSLMEKAGASEVYEETPEIFRNHRRQASYRMVGRNPLTLQIPPSASAALFRSIREISPELPVIAHPLTGRMHLVASANHHAALREKTLAVGGKHPMEWNAVLRYGLKGFFTPSEYTVALSLKRELDPDGVLNPFLLLE